MSRLTIVGSEKQLARPSTAQLALPDWDDAYLERVDLRGRTIPRVFNADLIFCDVRGTVFPKDGVGHVVVWRSQMDDATVVPTMASPCSGLVEAVLLRCAATSGYAGWDAARQHAFPSTGKTWEDTLRRLVEDPALAASEIWEAARSGFAPYPRMAAFFEWCLRHKDTWRSMPPDLDTRIITLEVKGEQREVKIAGRPELVGYDRHTATERLSKALRAELDDPRIRAHVSRLVPYKVVFAVGANIAEHNEAWWRERWWS